MAKKRARPGSEHDEDITPRKRQQTVSNHGEDAEDLTNPSQGSKKRSSHALKTPNSSQKVSLRTKGQLTPHTAAKNDRSARKKSSAALDSRLRADDSEDDAIDQADELLAREVLSEDEQISGANDEVEQAAGAEAEQTNGESAPDVEPTMPVKRGRGRPKGRRKERTPTPPPDLPAYELYFFHNRSTAAQTSANTLPAHALLNHDDYLTQIKAYKDSHEHDIKRLKKLHHRSFEQWQFELDEGYSLCLYGMGSKRGLIMDFVDYYHRSSQRPPTIAIVNGYNTSITIKDVLSIIAEIVVEDESNLPGQPAALLDTIVKASKTSSRNTLLVIHNLDAVGLRKPASQAMLAKLATLPQLSILASCDSLNFGLMWDLSLLRQYNFVYHDATTFEPWTIEVDPVEEVNALLGRSSRRLAGKDGVGYVLRSLPENARKLFKILVAEQLALGDIDFTTAGAYADDDDMLGASDEELAARQQNTPSKRGRGRPKKASKNKTAGPAEGVEYRMLYHKAVEEFVCSSEVNFRTLLKEFHDHQMIESRKDSMGTERLIVPFRRDELEAILEEL